MECDQRNSGLTGEQVNRTEQQPAPRHLHTCCLTWRESYWINSRAR